MFDSISENRVKQLNVLRPNESLYSVLFLNECWEKGVNTCSWLRLLDHVCDRISIAHRRPSFSKQIIVKRATGGEKRGEEKTMFGLNVFKVLIFIRWPPQLPL